VLGAGEAEVEEEGIIIPQAVVPRCDGPWCQNTWAVLVGSAADRVVRLGAWFFATGSGAVTTRFTATGTITTEYVSARVPFGHAGCPA
jgi:hypothetical protein